MEESFTKEDFFLHKMSNHLTSLQAKLFKMERASKKLEMEELSQEILQAKSILNDSITLLRNRKSLIIEKV